VLDYIVGQVSPVGSLFDMLQGLKLADRLGLSYYDDAIFSRRCSASVRSGGRSPVRGCGVASARESAATILRPLSGVRHLFGGVRGGG